MRNIELNEMLEIRVSTRQKLEFSEAAKRRGQTLSDFVRQSVAHAAKEIAA